jgi:uncharacterized protein YoxC
MPVWFAVVLALCVVAVTAALVPLLMALQRAVRRAEGVLGVVERELAPLVAELHGLTHALRDTIQELQQELKRVGALTDRIDEVAGGVTRVVNALVGLTRAGQFIGVAAGIRKGMEVFLHRVRKG